MRLDEVRADPRSARAVCSADLLCMSGFPVLASHAAAAGAPCIFTHGQPASSRRNGATMKRQCGNAMCVPHVGAVLVAALARFPTLGTRCGSSIPPAMPPPSAWPSADPGEADHARHSSAGCANQICSGRSDRRCDRSDRPSEQRKRHQAPPADDPRDEPRPPPQPYRILTDYERAVRARRARGLI